MVPNIPHPPPSPKTPNLPVVDRLASLFDPRIFVSRPRPSIVCMWWTLRRRSTRWLPTGGNVPRPRSLPMNHATEVREIQRRKNKGLNRALSGVLLVIRHQRPKRSAETEPSKGQRDPAHSAKHPAPSNGQHLTFKDNRRPVGVGASTNRYRSTRQDPAIHLGVSSPHRSYARKRRSGSR